MDSIVYLFIHSFICVCRCLFRAALVRREKRNGSKQVSRRGMGVFSVMAGQSGASSGGMAGRQAVTVIITRDCVPLSGVYGCGMPSSARCVPLSGVSWSGVGHRGSQGACVD